jgi:aspartyl-tRNA(Asn)/glutamyl-tRNA(Gln) amidotransferase subunit A
LTNPVQQPITEIAPLLASGEITADELLSLVLHRIDVLEPKLASYVTVLTDSARIDARKATEEIAAGRYRGLLHGIPVAVKDSIAVEGAPVTNGSRLWADRIADFDATVVSRLRQAGAIIVGKNNMHEWGMGGTCTGMYFGTVRNPWDLTRVPGGSSGGSATAVAAGLAMAAIGADGWGSIRTPASYCGVVGFMPTHGLVSRFGELPPTTSWHHTIGPITRTVADAALVLEAIAGHDPNDPTSIDADWDGGLDGNAEIKGLRIGIPSSYFLDDATEPVVEAVAAAQRQFEALGAELIDVDLSVFSDIPLVLAAAQHESQSVLLPLALGEPDAFATPEIRYRILAAEFVSAGDQRRAMQLRNRMRAQVLTVFESVDVVLTPCNSTVAFPIDAAMVPIGTHGGKVDLTEPGGQSRLTTRLTLPWNLTGVPAMSLPSGAFSQGMPIGIQLAAAPLADAALLRAALAYETASDGFMAPKGIASNVLDESVP